MKEIKEDINKWKDVLCSWIKRLNIVKMPKAFYRFNATPIKIPMTFFMNRKIYTKIYMKFEVTLKTQNNLAKKRTGRLTFHDFKTY